MQIYIINLARDEDRRKTAGTQLMERGLGFEFFNALTAENGWRDHFEAYDELQYLINTGRTAANGEIGCYASHRALWQTCIRSGQPIMIMEDDFLLSEDFSDAFLQTEKLIDKYGFIRLQTERRGKRKFVRKSGQFDLVYYTKMPHSLMCYAISPAIARVLNDHSQRLTAPVDVMIKKIWGHRQRLYGLMPYCVSENDLSVQTSIGGRIKTSKSMPVKWKRFFTKIEWAVKRRLFTFGFQPPD